MVTGVRLANPFLLRSIQPPLDFEHGTLILTEAGTKRQASLHVVQGREAFRQHDPGGLEVLEADLATFTETLRRDSHTLKRACAGCQTG